MSTKNIKNREALSIISLVASEKSINADDVFAALEEAIKATTKAQYGNVENICVRMDKKTGNIELYRAIKVVSDEDFEVAEDQSIVIALSVAKKHDKNINIDDIIEDPLPPLDTSRSTAQIAKGLIASKFKELEINTQYEQLKDRVGDIVQGLVRSIDKKGATLFIEGSEFFMSRSHMIKGDNFKNGDRMKVYLVKVEKSKNEIIMHLSRTHNDFLSKLLKNEVPEIQDQLIEIKDIIRDPGSRAKVAVYAADKSVDPIGSCIGIKGSRVQAVTSELAGERIDIVKWSPDTAQYIINCFAPIQILKIIMDEEHNSADIEVMDKDLSAVIGRQGQNIKLISKLTGVHVNVNAGRNASRNNDEIDINNLSELMHALDIDELLAQLLFTEGYKTVNSLIKAGEHKIAQVEGLDEGIAQELILRAQEYIAQNDEIIDENSPIINPAETPAYDDKPVRDKVQDNDNLTLMKEIRNALGHAGISNLRSIAEMSGEELQSILEESNVYIPRSKLDEIIMKLRNEIFFNVAQE
jgi:N utilization substance protein A